MFNDNEYEISKVSLVRCSLGKIFNFAIPNNYKYHLGDVLNRNNNDLTIMEQKRIVYNGRSIMAYGVQCNTCNSIFDISEPNLVRGDGCSYCSHHKVLIGKTDLWTTNPDICSFLRNKQDGFRYSAYSNQGIEFECPDYHEYLGYKTIATVVTGGIFCYKCGDGISYPNKFIRYLLDSLHIDYIPEGGYEWCVFPSFKDKTKLSHGRYDCVIESSKIIIEMDGGLGHGNGKHSHSNVTIDEQIYRDNQKNLIAEKHGYKVIHIDCNYSGHADKYNYCKNSILKSDLVNYFDLSNVNWDKINQLSIKSILYRICELFNQGLSSTQISKQLSMNLSTIIDYLHKGNTLQLVNYN